MPEPRANPAYLASNRRRARRLQAQGLCVTCGLDRGGGKARCSVCRGKNCESLRARRGTKPWHPGGHGRPPIEAREAM